MTIALTVAGTGAQLTVSPARLIVAGYTGRDEAAVRHHIDELAAIGIAPPPSVPMLYELDPALLSTAATVAVPGSQTSGEVEPVYVRHQGSWYLGVGSDHTDRVLERADVRDSKAACPKPVGPQVVPLPADVAAGGFDAAWDAMTAASSADGTAYQHGALAGLRAPSDLLPRVTAAVDSAGRQPDVVVFAGTLPLIDGEFRFAAAWLLTLQTPLATLTHEYTVSVPAS